MSAPATHLPEFKSKLSTLEILNSARSVGGLLGLLTVYLLCLRYPQLLSGGIDIKYALLFGLALGFGTQRVVENVFINPLIKPIYDYALYSFKLKELLRQRRRSQLTDAEFESLKHHLDNQYFLGDSKNSGCIEPARNGSE